MNREHRPKKRPILSRFAGMPVKRPAGSKKVSKKASKIGFRGVFILFHMASSAGLLACFAGVLLPLFTGCGNNADVLRTVSVPTQVISRQKTLLLNAVITVYHPTIKECGSDKNVQSCGDIGTIGSCAVSQRMLNYYVDYYDTIQVLNGTMQGKYVVKDLSGSKLLHVDVWRPVGDSIKACYKSKIKIIKKKGT